MVFGRKKEERVIEEEDEALARAKLLAEVAANIDVIKQFSNAFIEVQLMFWNRVKNDANIPEELKMKVFELSTHEFWETVRSGGIFTLSETVRRVGQIIREALMKALEGE